MIKDTKGEKVTPFIAAKKMFYVFGSSQATLAYDDFKEEHKLDFEEATEDEIEEYEKHIVKVNVRVKNFLGLGEKE